MTFTDGQRVRAIDLNSNVPQLLGTSILTGNQTSIPITIPAGFNHIQGIFTARQDFGAGGSWCTLRINGDSGNTYTWQVTYSSMTTLAAANSAGLTSSMRVGVLPGSGDSANFFGTGSFVMGNISSTTIGKTMSSQFQGPVSGSNGFSGTAGGLWASTAAVTSVTLLPTSGNLVAGSSLSIYGWD